MFYYLYQVTNKVNGKIYVGVHKTKNLDDGYMGSGKVIKRAIEKHGLENFEKVILESFEDQEAMYAREKEVVDEEFLARDDTYNLRRGGQGGVDWINKNGFHFKGFLSASDRNKAISPFMNGDERKKDILAKAKECRRLWFDEIRIDKEKYDEWKKNIHQGRIKSGVGYPTSQMRTPEAEVKRKETLKKIKHQQGEKNSQFGTCWVWHDLIGNKKCKKDLLPLYIDQGWIKGRF